MLARPLYVAGSTQLSGGAAGCGCGTVGTLRARCKRVGDGRRGAVDAGSLSEAPRAAVGGDWLGKDGNARVDDGRVGDGSDGSADLDVVATTGTWRMAVTGGRLRSGDGRRWMVVGTLVTVGVRPGGPLICTNRSVVNLGRLQQRPTMHA